MPPVERGAGRARRGRACLATTTVTGVNSLGGRWLPTLTRIDRVAGDRKLDGTRPPLDDGRDEAARSRRPPRPGGPARGRGVRRRQKKGGDRLVAA